MNFYQQLITLLPDVPVTTLSPVLMLCYNLGTVALFLFLLRLVAILVGHPAKYSQMSWGLFLGLFVFGRAMTTFQLVLHKSLIFSLEMSVLIGVGVGVITYLSVPFISKILGSLIKE